MSKLFSKIPLALFLIALFSTLAQAAFADNLKIRAARTKVVAIPQGQDRFIPFGATIRAGDSVQWVNSDSDEHIIKSDDFFNSVKERKIDQIISGTGANNGQPGTYTQKFSKPGLFIYFCSIHAELDSKHQPISRMGDGSAPMMGVISVIP